MQESSGATSSRSALAPRPSAGVVLGSALALAGYLLPWFSRPGYSWSFSGWAYAELSSGGGWTLLALAWLVAALVAGVWARGSATAAAVALGAVVGAGLLVAAVVSASFAVLPEPDALNPVADLPFGVGIPLMALGLGAAAAGACRAVVMTAERPRLARRREPS